MTDRSRFRIPLRQAWTLAAFLALGSFRIIRAAPHSPLTTAAEVRALTPELASRALPVHIRGVYMGEADPEGIAFVVQDQTEGIYVQGPANLVAGLGRGDLLDIEGVSDPGGFAPYIVANRIYRIGKGPIPDPAPVSLDELNSGQMDAKWIEITGVVRSVEPTAPSDAAPPPPGTRYAAPAQGRSNPVESKVKMKLASAGARVIVEIKGHFDPGKFVDAEVRLKGLCFNLHNRNRQFVRPFVQVPRGVEVEVERPPPPRPFGARIRAVASLLQFEHANDRQGHRVHVRGIVIHYRPGTALWVRDGDHSLRVETAQRESLRPGDEVDVLGFPAMGGYSAVLEDAVFRKLEFRKAPVPRVLSDVSSALRDDADLVQLEGRIVEQRRFPDRVAITLDWRNTPVGANLFLPEDAPAPGNWLAGSIVRVSGVCSVITDEARPLGGLWEPRSFQLLLRSPADVSIIRPPPWWNEGHVVWVLLGFLALALVAVVAVMLAARRRLEDQEHRRAMAEAEFAAILSERNRVAREIHDTLSQSLGAISVQLELVRTHSAEISEPARNHLGSAHKLARAALAEARDSIWNMRSQVLEQGDLGKALEGILIRMTEGTGVTSSMRVEGARRRLPPVVENNLLRIGQEAITNACKHGRPCRIDVALAFDGRIVRLAVEDDGVGFSVGSQPGGDRRSFGLVGIRERAELLGGAFKLASAPGQGTRLLITVSV